MWKKIKSFVIIVGKEVIILLRYCIITKNDNKALEIKKELIKRITLIYDENKPDYIITIGGDGTILGAIQQYIYENPKIIIFGLHLGHLGFFTNYMIEEIDDLISNINNQDFKIEHAPLLSFYIDSRFCGYALNEVSILCPTRTLKLDVYIDEEKLETYRGTGLCISTSYGSTAYNKSLHGSVVDTSLNVLQLTEIAGINSNAYRTLTSSLLLADDKTICLKTIEEGKITITYDNKVIEENEFNTFSCRLENNFISFAYNKHQSFLKRIKRTFIDEKK